MPRARVVGLKHLEVDLRRPARVIEDGRRRAQMHIEVVKGPTTDTTALYNVHGPKRPVLDYAKAFGIRVPKTISSQLAR
jgi:hypothetical protein